MRFFQKSDGKWYEKFPWDIPLSLVPFVGIIVVFKLRSKLNFIIYFLLLSLAVIYTIALLYLYYVKWFLK